MVIHEATLTLPVILYSVDDDTQRTFPKGHKVSAIRQQAGTVERYHLNANGGASEWDTYSGYAPLVAVQLGKVLVQQGEGK